MTRNMQFEISVTESSTLVTTTFPRCVYTASVRCVMRPDDTFVNTGVI